MNDDAYLIASVLSPRAVNALKRNGIKSVDQIKACYPEELIRIRGFGLRSLRAVEDAFLSGAKYKPSLDRPQGKKSVLSEELAQYLRERHSGGYDGLR